MVWCLTPTLAVFQLYRGMNFFYKLISTTTSPRFLCRLTAEESPTTLLQDKAIELYVQMK